MERDIAEKQLEEYSDVFADIVNVLVFEGKRVCQAENLMTLPTESYHRSESGKLRQGNRDVIKQDERSGTVIPDYQLNLIELAGLSETVRKRFTSDFRLIADFITSRTDIKQHRELMKDTIHKIKHPQEVLDVLGALGKDRRYKAIKESIRKRSEKEDVTMCMIAEELENKGIEKGIEKGIQEGEERFGQLILKMLASKNYDALKRVSVDKKYRNSLFKKYGL